MIQYTSERIMQKLTASQHSLQFGDMKESERNKIYIIMETD